MTRGEGKLVKLVDILVEYDFYKDRESAAFGLENDKVELNGNDIQMGFRNVKLTNLNLLSGTTYHIKVTKRIQGQERILDKSIKP